jgi:protein tyrosine phosphatase (PTP) superfamily phosphohydrolase (DUF442 family)
MIRRFLVLLTFLAVIAPSAAFSGDQAARPETWAKPVTLNGLPNLHKVSDTLYRSAQPEKEGFDSLKTLGVKTVVCLRNFHSDSDMIQGKGLGYEPVPMNTWHPKKEDAVRFLKIVTDPSKTPVLVHCLHGADRTGTMCAIYRVAVQGWTKENAIREMTEGGYNYHSVWTHLPPWIRDLDIDAIKKEAGIGPVSTPVLENTRS